MADYYGVQRVDIDLRRERVTLEGLRDPQGESAKAIFVNANTLESGNPVLLDQDELAVLREAVSEGSVLYVGGISNSSMQGDHSALKYLTEGAVVGALSPAPGKKNWHISNLTPSLAREFGGQTVSYNERAQDYALLFGTRDPAIERVITSTDDAGNQYATLARVELGQGQLLLDASVAEADLGTKGIITLANARYFSTLMPVMMFIRYALESGVWHAERTYANLTIDDPHLGDADVAFLTGLLQQSRSADFHATIAFPPVYYLQSTAGAVKLVADNPDRLSVVVHGNNHDGYEFYKYSTGPDDQYPARPFEEQEANIVEALARMESHRDLTGVHYGRVMVFPYGAPPERTLELLKRYNFNVTVNGFTSGYNLPLGGTRGMAFDFDAYPANLDYANFPMIRRIMVGNAWPALLFDAFLGRPIALYEHPSFFKGNIAAFDPIAKEIGGIAGGVEWASLDEIAKHLYLLKSNPDGTTNLRFFGNDIVVTNRGDTDAQYSLSKAETLNIPIAGVTVNGSPAAPYTVRDGILRLDLKLVAHETAEVVITYRSEPEVDYSVSSSDISFDSTSLSLTAKVRNLGTGDGPLIVEFLEDDPRRGRTLLGITSVKRVQSGESAVVQLPWHPTHGRHRILVKVNPYGIVPDVGGGSKEAPISISF